jgi:capsular polysaccharide biosynthesis protein
MDVNDVLVRVLRGHWRLFLVCLVVPLLAVGAFVMITPRDYQSSARLQGGTVLPGTDTEADALLNLIDGVATSPAVVNEALRENHLHRDFRSTVANIDIARLGSSTVFDVTVTDARPQAAAGLAQTVAGSVVAYLNRIGSDRTTSLLEGIAKREQDLAARRQTTATQLALATDAVSRANLSAELAGLDQQLNDLDATARQVQLGATPGSSSGAATLISPAGPAQPAPRHLAADLGLAAVAGLVLGLLVVATVEMLRPRVAGARALARDLEAPLLGGLAVAARRRFRRSRGQVRAGPADFVVRVEPDLLVALGAAVERLGVDLVLLIGPAPVACLSGSATALRNRLHERDDRSALNGRAPQTPPVGRHGAVAVQRTGAEGASPAGVDADPVVLLAERPALQRAGTIGERRPWRADIRPFDPTDVGGWTANPGLLVLVPPLAPLREVRRIGDLAASTAWPLIGVVELRWRGPRARRSWEQP